MKISNPLTYLFRQYQTNQILKKFERLGLVEKSPDGANITPKGNMALLYLRKLANKEGGKSGK